MRFIALTLAVASLFIFQNTQAQVIRILDENTRKPIEAVFISNQDQTLFTTSGPNGKADLTELVAAGGQLIFRHQAYELLMLSSRLFAGGTNTVMLREHVFNMEGVVISANKWEQDVREIPHDILSISPKKIEHENPQTTADVLSISGEVFVQKSQLGGGSPMIRGFAANRVLMVVDGVRLNNAIYRSGNLQNVITLDPNGLESAEVIFGPGSVIYGSDALGGVMDFHLKKPRLSSSKELLVQGNAMLRTSTANHEKTAHADINLGGKRFGSLTSFTYSDFDDLRTGSNRTEAFPDYGKRPFFVSRINGQDSAVVNPDPNLQVGSGYAQWNLIQQFRFRPNDHLHLDYSFFLTSSTDVPRYDRLIETRAGAPRSAEWYYGPQKLQMHSLRASFFHPTWLYSEARVTAGFQDIEESRIDRNFGSSSRRTRTESVQAFTLNADFEKEFASRDRLFYGLEVVHNDVGSTASSQDIETGETSPTSTRYPDGGSDWSSAAAYASLQHFFNDRWIFSSGIRFSHFWVNSRFEDRQFFDFPFDEISLNEGAFNGSAGIVWLPNDSWKISLNLSSGFRAPNVDDVGKVFDSEPGNVVVPNADLGPEFTYNSELILNKQFGERFNLGAVLYYTLLEDAMVRRNFTFNGQDSIIYDGTLSRVEAIVNTGSAYIWGYSLRMQWRMTDQLSLSATLNDNEGMDKDDDVPLRHTTPLFGAATLQYKRQNLQLSLIANYQGSIAFEDLAPSEQDKAFLYTADGALSWWTLNLKGSYQLSDHWSVSAGLENIFDKHYRPYSSGISAPGINAYFAARASF